MDDAPNKIGDLTNGPAWAAILSAAVGCCTFGVAVDLAEASKAISKLLNWYNPVGDLSGKSICAVAIWLACWIVLHAAWQKRNLRSTAWIAVIALLLIAAGLLMTFPPFFSLFEAK